MIASLETGVIKSFDFVLGLILISATRSAMSHRPWEESAPDPETPNPVTPTKPQRNTGAGQDNPDAEIPECQYDSDELFRKKKKKRTETKKRERHLIVYVPIKRWQRMADRRKS
jgi:hypothetical protein